jgi:glycosyltransferase involved in cell wall biosynthesis
VLPPAVGFPVPGLVTRTCNAFVFVGSDSLLQNRLSIEFLVDLWRTTRPERPLQIIGRMTRPWPETPGVRFEGFVADLAEIYRNDVVALSPSFVEGGIKTKVLEALGYGTLAVGNALTFEGMGCDPGPLAMSAGELAAFVGDPGPRLPALLEAGTALRRCIESRTSPEAIEGAWAAIVTPPA